MVQELDVQEVLTPVYSELLQGVKTWEDVKKLGKENIDGILTEKRHFLPTQEKQDSDFSYQRLLAIRNNAKSRPLLPGLRNYDSFSKGDEIVLYIHEKWPGAIKHGLFEATITSDHQFHKFGAAQFKTDEEVFEGEEENATIGGFGMSTTYGMLKSDFDYLVANPGYVNFWFSNTKKESTPEGLVELILDNSQLQ